MGFLVTFFGDTYIITLQLGHEIISVAVYSWSSGFLIGLKEHNCMPALPGHGDNNTTM
jgi:hypothetical protein